MDIISAFAEGKTIQYKTDTGSWHDLTESEGLPMGTMEEEPNNFRIKPEPKFRPFKDAEECWGEEKDDVWEAELFSHYKEESQYPFRCIGFSRKYCIPYNKETAHLLGTTDDWEGGEQ